MFLSKPAFVAALLTSNALALPSSHAPFQNQSTADSDASFDYIVVGSGPGGGPLAVNLAEAGYSVLLLEAGQNHTTDLSQTVPAFFGVAQSDEKQGWWFYTKQFSNETQAGLNDKMVWEKPGGGYWVGRDPPEGSTQLGIWYPRAGTLGGCDTHNGGITVRPSDWDWDNIASTTSDASWNHEHMLGYFEKLERNLFLPHGTPGHGFNGYQPVGVGNKSLFEQDEQLLAVAQGTAATFGYDERSTSRDYDVVVSKDINKYSPDRDFQNDVYQVSFKKDEQGRRYSAGNRVNWAVSTGLPLTVRFDSLVTKVLIDDHLRATGVEYLEGEKLYKADPRSDVTGASRNNTGVRRTAKATREVIISGGTFNTPQILMLSGIGPKKELRQHGIRTRVDLPGVGKNLQDHYEVPVIQQFPSNFTFWNKCNPGSEVNPCFDEWENNGTGPYTTVGFSEFVLYTSSVAPRGERDIIMYGYPDAILGHIPPYANASALSGPSYYTFTISESHSRNRAGAVTLRSSDPRDVPEINFEYFVDGADEDLQGLVDGVQFARKIFATILGSDAIASEAYPGPEFASDDKLREYARAQSYGHHATGTASIGADDDPMAVLDTNFRVRGVKGLRVVDASIFPVVPGTFPLIAIFMMSEKASDVILADATN